MRAGGEWKSGGLGRQQLKDKLTKPLQRAVGGKKTRYVDKQHGLDLNLCYITQTCVAMGLPAEQTEGLLRNSIREVARFFDLKHPVSDCAKRFACLSLDRLEKLSDTERERD